MAAGIFSKQYLMTPGPTPLPPTVVSAMAEPMDYHRGPAFTELYARVLARLREVFQTSSEVLLFAASGSGAMESAAANLVRPGEAALVARCGKFGERWRELCEVYGARTIDLDVEWGERVEPDDLDRALAGAGGEAGVVFTTLSETSTGVVNDAQALAEVTRAHGALICLDAVSGLGAVELRMDDWGIDAVAAGSQKALMCPPGLAFLGLSERALERARTIPTPRYYFDFERTLAEQRKDPPVSPFTPAVSLVRGLDAALGLVERETLEGCWARHALLGQATREAVKALGLELFGPDDERAAVVTAVVVPEGVDGAAIPKLMRDRLGITVAGGQSRLKGRIVRIAHCGWCGAFDVLTAVAGLELALAQLGAGIELGAGVAAAERTFAAAGVTVTSAP